MIDLHCHSTASDGVIPPERLPAMAQAAGLSALALTDHDTVGGIPAFLAAAEACGLRGIPGVELATRFAARELHVVGLFIDPAAPELSRHLAAARAERQARAERLLIRLANAGYPLTMEEVREAGGGEAVGRPHFARALMRKYQFPTIREVFDKLLKRGAAAYEAQQLPAPEEAVRVIRASGGVAVWAHPIHRSSGERSFLKRMLARMIPAGLDAMEAYYSEFTPAQTALVLETAAQFHLAVSGGSDFHGDPTGPQLGCGNGALAVPDALLPELEKRRGERVVLL